jgi:hypothetical protein
MASKMSKRDRKRESISFFLTERDFERIDRYCETLDLNRSELCRTLVIAKVAEWEDQQVELAR